MIELVDGSYTAKILKDSISPDEVRLTTIEVTFPRIVLAEFNTHRMFSRNSASSRAIPVKTMLQKIKKDSFIPFYWGKNQKGMQAVEELSFEAQQLALEQWILARDKAIEIVERMQKPDIDLHKQIANRLLEPFMYHTVICTATEWDNFFSLRCHKDAQPEIRKIAVMMQELYNSNTPSLIKYNEWHLPLTSQEEINEWCTQSVLDSENAIIDLQLKIDFWKKVSAGRCARVSYLTHDGRRDLQADVDLCERLRSSGHMSPLEHVARPMDWYEAHGIKPSRNLKRHPGNVFSGNFRGWVQFRKELPNEEDFSKVTV